MKLAKSSKMFFRSIKMQLMRIIPSNGYGDHIFAFLDFIIRHKRIPTSKLIFNDVLFKIKITELTNPLRIFVSDKEYLKIYVKATVGEKYNVPTLPGSTANPPEPPQSSMESTI